MKKSDSFIEDRIRWRASLHGIPKKNTYFWENLKQDIKIDLPDQVGNPVLVSVANDNEFVVLCTRGVVVNNCGIKSTFLYDEIDTICDVVMSDDEKKEELTRLSVKLTYGNEITIVPEPYSTAFSVWNILIMLKRMN